MFLGFRFFWALRFSMLRGFQDLGMFRAQGFLGLGGFRLRIFIA